MAISALPVAELRGAMAHSFEPACCSGSIAEASTGTSRAAWAIFCSMAIVSGRTKLESNSGAGCGVPGGWACGSVASGMVAALVNGATRQVSEKSFVPSKPTTFPAV